MKLPSPFPPFGEAMHLAFCGSPFSAPHSIMLRGYVPSIFDEEHVPGP